MRFAFLLCLALVSGCASVPHDASIPDGTARIYVVERAWHTDIGLPVDEVSGPLASLQSGFPGIRFMVFGFGERAYYMAHDESSFTMLAALFPSRSAILLTALRASPDVAFADDRVATLRLPQSGVDRIAEAIWQSLEKRDGSAVRLADGPYPGSVFYAGSETYDAFHTCNTWTALLLRDAGFPVNTSVLFADDVMRQAQQIAARQAR
ncbi:MAG TPA: DUF2459 domain-containing protein [Acetobacteraceae bacterium]|nr:DUF2459 domain-containing protein [Acetobacteraceae bacterium]